MKLERIQQGIASTIHADLIADGLPVDPTPDSATVTLTRDSDGTTLGTFDCYDEGTGEFSHTVSPTEAAELDILTAAWSMTYGGYDHTFDTKVEIVGGFLFTIAAARSMDALANATAYPSANLVAARSVAETALEEACGLSFVPRYFRTKVDGAGTCDVLLPSRPLSITSVTVGASSSSAGTTLSVSDLADLELYDDGRVYRAAGWPVGRRNIEIKGAKGYPFPPPRVGTAALLLAKAILVSGPVDERATSFTTDGGTFTLSTPGMRGAVFGIPEVDAVVQQYGVAEAVG